MTFDDDLAEAEALTRRIEEQVSQAQVHAEKMQTWAEQVDRISAEGSALRGAVRVSVNNGGVVTGLRLTDAALDAGAAGLGQAILQAINAAKQSVADETGRSAAEHFGRDGEVTRLMVADLTKRLGVTADLDGTGPQRPGPAGGVIG